MSDKTSADSSAPSADVSAEAPGNASTPRTVALDTTSPVPLYFQLRKALERSWRIEHGPEDDLPTEQEIMDRFNVSRITVRRAIDDMVAAGVIHRPRVRARLRWAPVRVRKQLNRLKGFFVDGASAGGSSSVARVLEVSRGAWPEANEYLGLPDSEECYRISRVHEDKGRPLSHQVSYIPCRACPDLLLSDLAGSLLSMLESRYEISIGHAEQRLRAREATADELKLLQLPPKAYVFEVDRVSYAVDGRPVEYFDAVLDVAHYEFLTVLDPQKDGSTDRIWPSPWIDQMPGSSD